MEGKKKDAFYFEVDGGDLGKLTCDYYPSPALVERFERFFDENPPSNHRDSNPKSLHSASIHLYTGAAMVEFIHGMAYAMRDAMAQQFEFSIRYTTLSYEGQGLRDDIDTIRFQRVHKRDALKPLIELFEKQIKKRIEAYFPGSESLKRLSFYYGNLYLWKEAKEIYTEANKRGDSTWRKLIKDKNDYFPDDLIEWLRFSAKSEIEAGDFPSLSDPDRERLEKRLIDDGQYLTTPNRIALEHAARLCGAAPYLYPLQHLKNTISAQKSPALKKQTDKK